MKLESFSFWILIFFSMIGLITMITVIHEYTHMFEYKSLEKKSDSLCALNLPTLDNYKDYEAIGYYDLSYTNETKFTILDKHSEIKAYLSGIIPILLFFICFIIILNRRLHET